MQLLVPAHRLADETPGARAGRRKAARRRGVAAVQVAIMAVVLIGFAALTVDVGHLYVIKAELQVAVDSAARAGGSAFADDSLRANPYNNDEEFLLEAINAAAAARAVEYAGLNHARGVSPLLAESDLVVGTLDFQNPTAPLTTGGLANAVQVTARLTDHIPNGAVTNLFARVMGFSTSNVTASATAAFDDRFAGYTPIPGVLTPFAIQVDDYEDQRVNGPDDFSYDQDLDNIESFGDGIREIRLFPYADEGGGDGAGNFGLLNIGVTNQGVPGLQVQIGDGITPAELAEEIGTSELSFADESGHPVTYTITGNPGMSNGVECTVQARVGDVIGFFLYSVVVDPGSNATYTIVGLRFGRLMEVHLTGVPEERRVRIQPAVYTDPGVRTDENAPSSGGLIGRVVLVK